MRMNTRIPMMGQQVDVVNALDGGFAAGRKRGLADLYQQHGQGIASGDAGAINKLAQFDPQAAMGVQGAHQDMAMQQQRMGILSAQEKRAIEAHAAKLSTVERQEQAARVQQGLMSGIQAYEAGDLSSLNAILQQAGENPIQSLQEFPAVAAKYKEVFQTLSSVREFNAPPKPADEYGRYVSEERGAGRQPLSRIDYSKAKQKSSRVSVGKDGNVLIEEGSAVGGEAPPKLTVDAAKNTGFLIRTRDANKTLNELEGQGTRFMQQNLDGVPLGIGNYFRDDEFQKFDQARRDFVNAILRRESGAVIADSEFDNADKQYFPVPGDGPEVIAQKRRNRENAIRGLEVGSGEGAGFVDRQDAAAAESSEGFGLTPEDTTLLQKYGLSPSGASSQ